jgi:hypothetical protein
MSDLATGTPRSGEEPVTRRDVLLWGVGGMLALGLGGCVAYEATPPAAPAPPAEVVPARPGPAHVWVEGHWAWRGPRRGYVWAPGYWAVPTTPGYVWVPGRWVPRRRGYVWVEGHWQRR